MHRIIKIGANNFGYINLLKYNCSKFRLPSCFQNYSIKSFSQNGNKSDKKQFNRKINFDDMIAIRRQEAKQSILVQVHSEKSYPELYNYCSQFGRIKEALHYKQDELHFILLEYENQFEANDAIGSSIYNDDNSGILVQSPFLWFRAGPKNHKIAQNTELAATTEALNIIDGNKGFADEELTDFLQIAETLDDQITVLHKLTCLNDLGARLRFLAAHQIERSISGMFPTAKAFPFGSSVNGFGKLGCDLDLILRLRTDERKNEASQRLVFHTKENLANGRSQIQRYMENISDLIQLYLPGVCHVRRILQARIPIIKYRHEHLDLEVDLSMSNLTGVYMSELLYMFGEIDERVQPLTFCIRRWAQAVGITNPSPGRWISNFSLTCLVIYFLQQLDKPILPSLNTLVKQARSQDNRITEDNINCTFLRDLNSLKFAINNQDTLQELLLTFFEFYSQMNFNDRAISLNDSKTISKPDHSAMYIVNPLEILLNITKNVSLEECERFRIEVRNAAWILESNSHKTDVNMPWGLLSLFKTPQQSLIRPNMFFKPRMVDVSELFDGQKNDNDNGGTIQFKNEFVRNEISKIKKNIRSDIKGLKKDSLQRVRKR